MGLDKDTVLSDLDQEKMGFLTSACVLRLLRQGASPDVVNDLVMDRHWLYDWGLYADQLSSLLNSCARQGEHGLGLALALGDKEAREKAVQHGQKHREYIITCLRELEANPPEQMDHIQHFETKETAYAGVLAGLGTLYFFDTTKATFGFSDKDGKLNVSARAPRSLVEAGTNLGIACREAGESVKGTGGGHDIAAGATVPSKSRKMFLKELDRIVGRQLAAK